MDAAGQPPKRMGRPRKAPGERKRDNKITVYPDRKLYDQVLALAEEASRIRGLEISESAVAALILAAGIDQVSAKGIARDAP